MLKGRRSYSCLNIIFFLNNRIVFYSFSFEKKSIKHHFILLLLGKKQTNKKASLLALFVYLNFKFEGFFLKLLLCLFYFTQL